METFRVLIVDDEADFLETIVKRLQKRGLDVAGAGSGREALSLLESREFDVVVLDVKMTGMDGIATLRELKRRRPATEVIMLTGHASVESGLQGMELGAFDYMMKPADIDDLMDKIRQAFERKRIHEGSSPAGGAAGV